MGAALVFPRQETVTSRATAAADGVLARHLTARGGLAAWSAVRGVRRTSRLYTFEFVATWVRPDAFRLDQRDGDSGRFETRVVRGHDGWTVSSEHAAPRTLSAPEVVVLREEAAAGFEVFLLAALGGTAALAGEETSGGRVSDRLVLRLASGREIVLLIDRETGREVARVRTDVAPDGASQQTRLLPSAWRALGSVQFAHAVGEAAYAWELDPAVPPGFFIRPAGAAPADPRFAPR